MVSSVEFVEALRVVEQAESWVHKYRHLKMYYDRRNDIHEGFLAIG